VCRGKAARGSRLVSQGLGPRLAAGHAAALRARGRGKAAYNLVKIKRLRYYTGFVGNATAVVSCIDSAISQAPNFIKISPVVNKYLRGLKFKNRSRDPDHTPQITSVSGGIFSPDAGLATVDAFAKFKKRSFIHSRNIEGGLKFLK